MQCVIRPPKVTVLLQSETPLLCQHLLPLHPTYMTELPTDLPLPQVMIVLTSKSEHLHHDSLSKGHESLLVSLVTNGANTTSIPPITGNLTLSQDQRLLPCSAMVGCRFRILLQTCKLSHPLNHGCPCS